MKEFVQFIFKFISVILSIVVMGFWLWFFKPEDTISMAAFLGFTAPLLLLCLLLVERQILLSFSEKKKGNLLPKLKLINADRYIFEPSEIFSSGSFVSLFYLGDIERFVGWGKIETVISNTRNLQVVVLGFVDNYTHDILRVDKQNIVLKPTIPFDIIQQTAFFQFLQHQQITSGES